MAKPDAGFRERQVTFRVIGVRGGLQTLAASRRALLLLSVAPVWLVTAVVCLGLWPGRQNAGHIVVLGLLGMILADLFLLRFRKIPFTCSWLPGKSYFHMVFLGASSILHALLGTSAQEPAYFSGMNALVFFLSQILTIAVMLRVLASTFTRKKGLADFRGPLRRGSIR